MIVVIIIIANEQSLIKSQFNKAAVINHFCNLEINADKSSIEIIIFKRSNCKKGGVFSCCVYFTCVSKNAYIFSTRRILLNLDTIDILHLVNSNFRSKNNSI